jgi:hypothetical protein
MDSQGFDRFSQSVVTSGTRRAALGALLGAIVVGTPLDVLARGKRRNKQRSKRQGGARVQAEGKPEIESGEFSYGPEFFVSCGSFDALIKGELTYTIKWFSDRNDIVVKGVETVQGTDIFIHSDTGKEIAAPFRNNVLIDPLAGLGANMGIIFKVTVPGAGAVFLDIGRVVGNQAGTVVTFQAGPHQFFDGDFTGLCAALAS